MNNSLRWMILALLCAAMQTIGAQSRSVENFNRDWLYAQGFMAGAEQPDYDDTSWQRVGLPHSFSIPYFLSKDFYQGYGVYRKRFTCASQTDRQRTLLEFDGAFQETEVYVNGQLAGRHRGGYTGFVVDITDHVRKGNNLVTVRVNNIWRPDLAPRGGEHVFSGGIYRNVRLVRTSPVHIAWYGVSVATEGLKDSDGQEATVVVTTEIANPTELKGDYLVSAELVTPDGKRLGKEAQRVQLTGDTLQTVVQRIPVREPQLWHPDTPHLYKIESTIYKGSSTKKALDRTQTPFGFRWMEWDADNGFSLNGKHLVLRGANAHQDQAGWGDAVTDAAQRRDVAMLKEAGFNFIRGSHYPHSPAYLQACDELGMLYWSEAPFWGTAGPKDDGSWTASSYPIVEKDCEPFEQNALMQLEEMIRIHRNSPSIIAWSMCNEPFFCASQTLPGVKRLLARMVERTHQLDSSRPAAIGGAQRPLGSDRIDLLGDVAGYNGDGGTIADFQHPAVPNLVSEYGSTIAQRPGKYAPGWGDLSRDDHWKGHPWRSGQAIWCAFDHGSIFGTEMETMGIVDYFRIPKRAWYWYRSNYAGIEPPQWPVDGTPATIRLTPSTTSAKADGTDDIHLLVTLLDSQGREVSASPDVVLTIVSGPGEFPTGRSITFSQGTDIPIIEGKAAIAMRAYQSGTTRVEATCEGLPAASLELRFTDGPAFDPEKDTVAPRPYVRFVRGKSQQLQTFGQNNPVFVSSSAEGHSAGYAADGVAATYWQPAATDPRPTLILDTERSFLFHSVKVDFAGPTPSYKVELSLDNEHWQPLPTDGTHPFVRFVRLTFDEAARPCVSSITATGTFKE